MARGMLRRSGRRWCLGRSNLSYKSRRQRIFDRTPQRTVNIPDSLFDIHGSIGVAGLSFMFQGSQKKKARRCFYSLIAYLWQWE